MILHAGASCLIAWVAASAAPTCPARAATEARARYLAADYRGAVAATERVEQCSDGTPHEIAEALRWRAQAEVSQGDAASARRSFALLEAVWPGYQLPVGSSPKFKEALEAGRELARAEGTMVVRLLAPDERLVRVAVHAARRRSVGTVLFLFGTGDAVKVRGRALGDDAWGAPAPPEAGRYTAVVERDGAVVARSPGGELEPLPRAAPEDAPLAPALEPNVRAAPAVAVTAAAEAAPQRSVWPFVAVGAGAAAVVIAVVGAVAAVQASQPERGSLGRVELAR